jgi:heme exporter protein A
MTASLTFSNLACVRGGRVLFKGLNATLGPGEALLLTGPNGVGKSSLLRLIAGLLPAYAGKVTYDVRLALSDENPALDPRLPLAKALGYWAGMDGTGPGAVSDALDALDMARLAEVPVRLLSTGQRRRANLARVLASGADIWLLDEPGNGLDTASLALLERAIAAHRAQGGIVVVASHQPLGLTDAQALALEAAE